MNYDRTKKASLFTAYPFGLGSKDEKHLKSYRTQLENYQRAISAAKKAASTPEEKKTLHELWIAVDKALSRLHDLIVVTDDIPRILMRLPRV